MNANDSITFVFVISDARRKAELRITQQFVVPPDEDMLCIAQGLCDRVLENTWNLHMANRAPQLFDAVMHYAQRPQDIVCRLVGMVSHTYDNHPQLTEQDIDTAECLFSPRFAYMPKQHIAQYLLYCAPQHQLDPYFKHLPTNKK